MKAFRFELKYYLGSVGALVDRKHIQVLSKSSLKSAKKLYTGLLSQGKDDDPIDIPDSFAAGIGRDAKESIDSLFRDTGGMEAEQNDTIWTIAIARHAGNLQEPFLHQVGT